jgi:hypothetical protein
MTIRMSNLERLTLGEMAEFVTTSRRVTWSAVDTGSVYKLIERVLKAQQYRRLSKGQRGIVKRFLARVTALSRAQLTRLIQRWMETRRIERKPARRPSFHRRYTNAYIASLAEVDAAHEDLSGAGGAASMPPSMGSVWQREVPTAGGHLGIAHLQPAAVGGLPKDSCAGGAHQGKQSIHRGASPAGPERKAGASAGGHGSSGAARRAASRRHATSCSSDWRSVSSLRRESTEARSASVDSPDGMPRAASRTRASSA